MNNFNKKLIEYGVPFTEVMERFVNDEELYCSCFQSFLEDSSFVALSTAIQLKDYNMAFEYAHTLKGVAGNLGLTPL
ncbi:MAG: Hpt domain-containing protein, partial [Oscillospiraceae bacterium]